jgi:hypothetical protein
MSNQPKGSIPATGFLHLRGFVGHPRLSRSPRQALVGTHRSPAVRNHIMYQRLTRGAVDMVMVVVRKHIAEEVTEKLSKRSRQMRCGIQEYV